MSRRTVRVFGGPLDGGIYELYGEPGSLINLNTAAGVCTYQFATSDQNEQIIVKYVGSAADDSGRRRRQAKA